MTDEAVLFTIGIYFIGGFAISCAYAYGRGKRGDSPDALGSILFIFVWPIMVLLGMIVGLHDYLWEKGSKRK